MNSCKAWALGLICLAVSGWALAQPPIAPPEEDKAPTVVPSAPGTLKDPTRASDKMKAVLGTKTGPAGTAAPKISPLALRGRVIAKDKPAAALLEVDGKLYTVTKGSTLAGPNNTIYRVVEVNSDEVRIEVSPQKETIILR